MSNASNAVKDYAKNVIEKLNLFKLLQLIWLIEFHLLAFLSVKYAVNNVFNVMVNEPPIITKFCQQAINWMDKYEGYLFYVSIASLVIGLSGVCLIQIPIFRKYKLIYEYTDFGLYACAWLFFIWVTYRLFIITNAWFLVIPVVVFILYTAITKLLEKLGISING